MPSVAVYDGVKNSDDGPGGLFQGRKFYVSHTVPQRQQFIAKIKNNGGEVVDLEKQADILLYDHLKKNVLVGSYSYKYVESSVRNGRLDDLNEHRIGAPAGSVRPVGSISTAPKGGRTHYSDADDQLLFNLIKPMEIQGLQTKGNEIYKDIEATYGRHPWQSWRDRWVKYVCRQDRNITATPTLNEQPESNSPETTPILKRKRDVTAPIPNTQPQNESPKASPTPKRKRGRPRRTDVANVRAPTSPVSGIIGLGNQSTRSPPLRRQPSSQSSQASQDPSNDIFDALFAAAPQILRVDPANEMEAWTRFESQHNSLSAEQWRDYFHEYVKPKYQEEIRRLRDRKAAGQDDQGERSKDDARNIRVFENSQSNPPSPALPRRRSPSWQPSSPTIQDRPTLFAANEARKRSPIRQSKTDSQETQATHSSKGEQVDKDPPWSGALKRKRGSSIDATQSSPNLPTLKETIMTQTPTKNRVTAPEIASTPDPDAPLADPEQTGNPLFYPEMGRGNRETDASATPLSPIIEGTTDPLDIKLVSEGNESNGKDANDNLKRQLKSFAAASDELESRQKDSGEDSDAEDFETAPTSAAIPDNQGIDDTDTQLESKVFETSRTRQRFETQDMFNTQPSLHFSNLPPPAGGWSNLASPTRDSSSPPRFAPPSPPPDSPPSPSPSPSGSDSPPPSDLTTWLSRHLLPPSPDGRDTNTNTNTNPQTRELLALSALSSITTSRGPLQPSDYALADDVFAHLLRTRRVPDSVRGVWTEDDDERLMSGGDARGIEAVRAKHGDEAMEARWEVKMREMDMEMDGDVDVEMEEEGEGEGEGVGE